MINGLLCDGTHSNKYWKIFYMMLLVLGWSSGGFNASVIKVVKVITEIFFLYLVCLLRKRGKDEENYKSTSWKNPYSGTVLDSVRVNITLPAD